MAGNKIPQTDDWEKVEDWQPSDQAPEMSVQTLPPGAAAGGESPAEAYGRGESAFRAAAEGATMGWSAELEALARQPMNPAKRKALRQLLESRYQASQRKYPVMTTAAEIGGTIPTMFIPGLNVAKGAGLVAAAGRGALAGGIYGLGKAKAGIDEPVEMVKEAVPGAAMGAGLGAAGTAIGKMVSPGAFAGLRSAAEERALKATTGQGKGFLKDLYKQGLMDLEGAGYAGRALLNPTESTGKPLVGWMSRSKDIAKSIEPERAMVGQKIGDIGNIVEQVTPQPISGTDVAGRMQNWMRGRATTTKDQGWMRALTNEAKDAAREGGMTFERAKNLKGSYRFNPTDTTTQTLGQDATNAARRAYQTAQEDAVTNAISQMGPKSYAEEIKLLQRYPELTKKYQGLKALEAPAVSRAIGDVSNRKMSLTDYITSMSLGGGAAAAAQNPAVLAATPVIMLGHKLIRERGSAFSARLLDKIGSLGQQISGTPYAGMLAKAAEKGNAALIGTHLLLYRQDPNYRQLSDQMGE